MDRERRRKMNEQALEQEPCDDAVSREAVIAMAYDMSAIDGEHFEDTNMVVDVDDIRKLPSVQPKTKTIVNHGTMNITL